MVYLLPDAGEQVRLQLLADLARCRHRLHGVLYLPPCGRLTMALADVAHRLAGQASVLVDGTTHYSLSRWDADWMPRVRLPRGSVHAKVLVVDDVVWWGSWNFQLVSLQQYDVVQRSQDEALVARMLTWLGKLHQRTQVVPMGSGATAKHDSGRPGHPLIDPDLGF